MTAFAKPNDSIHSRMWDTKCEPLGLSAALLAETAGALQNCWLRLLVHSRTAG